MTCCQWCGLWLGLSNLTICPKCWAFLSCPGTRTNGVADSADLLDYCRLRAAHNDMSCSNWSHNDIDMPVQWTCGGLREDTKRSHCGTLLTVRFISLGSTVLCHAHLWRMTNINNNNNNMYWVGCCCWASDSGGSASCWWGSLTSKCTDSDIQCWSWASLTKCHWHGQWRVIYKHQQVWWMSGLLLSMTLSMTMTRSLSMMLSTMCSACVLTCCHEPSPLGLQGVSVHGPGTPWTSAR